MTWIDIIAMAASNLWRRKLRTILTVLGVIIGTACIVIMVALGLGNLQQFEDTIMQSTSLTEIQVYGYSNTPNAAAKITDSTIDQFKQIAGVKNATAIMEIPVYLKLGKYSADLTVLCVDPEAMPFNVEEGRLFQDGMNLELVLGSNAKQNFMDEKTRNAQNSYSSGMVMSVGSEEMQEPVGPDIDWLGETFNFLPTNSWQIKNPDPNSKLPAPKQYKARITGLLAQSDDEQSYNAYMSLETGKKIFRENRKLMEESYGLKSGAYNRALVYVNTIEDAATVLDEIKAMGLEAYSPTEWITQMQDEQKRQQGQLSAIGMISLIISAIGIANTMLASILERRREIGVMKVIGLSVSKINLMFLVEAAMIGLVGGLIGVALSYIFSLFAGGMGGENASFFGMYFSNGIQLVIPFWLSLGAVAIATGVGVVSGIYPAWRATKLSPLEAIRSTQ